MFFHKKVLQNPAMPERPDPLFAKKLQEILGGQFGEISVAMQYLFQGWNTRGHDKYKDLIMDTATEEIGHVEMIATMIARLLDDAPVKDQEEAAKNPVIESILGGMNPQHAIVSGLGAMPVNSVGVPWNAGYIVASGNLLADFRANLNAESQGRLQVARLYEMTDDRGIKDMLSFLLTRDTMHQNQWLAAIRELEAKEGVIVPSTAPPELEKQNMSHVLYNFSEGEESSLGSWASGQAPDGAEFQYSAEPGPFTEEQKLKPAPPYTHNTLPGVTE
ncbi:manganese catalase family protein [Paenibacillus sp. F411]|uniref:manganese catalase family protein n=1 Tax=Paenibacillus sp. F411 TaxID=2820239 RepID=UPI001AAEC03D|nr:manganese catalase family protein [Paenibacillus sp. F411]MBO2945572.1 manganese catalase family protein [Paenibacillus sp. F411]